MLCYSLCIAFFSWFLYLLIDLFWYLLQNWSHWATELVPPFPIKSLILLCGSFCDWNWKNWKDIHVQYENWTFKWMKCTFFNGQSIDFVFHSNLNFLWFSFVQLFLSFISSVFSFLHVSFSHLYTLFLLQIRNWIWIFNKTHFFTFFLELTSYSTLIIVDVNKTSISVDQSEKSYEYVVASQ